MKKFLLSIVLLLVLAIGAVFGLLFTKAGNNLLKPLIESRLKAQLPVAVELKNFQVSPTNIELLLGKDSLIKVTGNVGFLDRSLDLRYFVDIKNLEDLKPLTNAALRGPLKTEGSVEGRLDDFKVVGSSDLAKSDTKYRVAVKSFEPREVIATVKDASISRLLYMVMQPPFIEGRLNVDANLKDLDPEHLKGDLQAMVKGASVDRKLMKKEFGVSLPKTTIDSVTKAKLSGKLITIDSHTLSNLAKIVAKGSIKTDPLSTDLSYVVDVKDLALLKPLTGADVRGGLYTKGKVKGDKSKTIVTGYTDLAGSKSDYKLILREYKPVNVEAKVKGAKLAKIFYMLKLPHYADAAIDATVVLSNLDPKHLSGKVLTHVKDGRTDPATLQREFDFQNARISFTATQDTVIKNAKSVSNIQIDSSVANVESKGALFDLSTGKLDATYEALIPNLDKLYFAAKQHMRGKLKITGKVQKDKNLLITAHSDTLGGAFDMKMVDNDLKATLRHIKFVELTDMLLYPRIFDSVLSANLTYDIATKHGKLNAKAVDGHILPNKMSFLLRQMANFDITKEIYKETLLTSTINDKKILSDLDMKSRLTHISSKKALVDLDREYIDAKLRVEIKKRPVYVKVRGKLKSPNISIDAGSIVKERAKKVIEKKLEKNLQNKLPGAAKGLLKMF